MLSKRLIVCLDVRDKKVTKGVKFADNFDVGDPVELAAKYRGTTLKVRNYSAR
jgi:cyclase